MTILQQPFDFMMPDASWSPPTSFPDLQGAIAVDLETCDPLIKSHGPGWCFPAEMRGWIAGVSVADSAGFVGYFPVRHGGGGNLPETTVFRWLREQFKKRRPVVFANATYDLGWLTVYDCLPDFEDVHDVQIQAPLLDENRMWYNLDSLARDYIGERKDEKLLKKSASAFGLKDAKGSMHLMPAPYVGPYAEQDARVTLGVFNVLMNRIIEEGLTRIYDLERALIPLLLQMRFRGVRIDLPYAERLSTKYKKQEKEAVEQIRTLSGRRIDPWMNADIAMVLKDLYGVDCPKTEKTGVDSITKDFLDGLASQGHAVPKLILQARDAQKMYSTFVENYVLNHQVNGRVHAQFNALRSDDGGTVSGRFSSSDPSLQNIPARDPVLGPEIREMFIPEEGEIWASNDYSSQEPRLTVHYAKLAGCTGADEAVRRYNEDPNTDYHQMVAEMCGIPRKQAKNINLGLAYGMGGLKLCKELGLPTEWVIDERATANNKGEEIQKEVPGEEARGLFELYHTRVPFIKELTDACTRKAHQAGYIKTILNRHCHFPERGDKKGHAMYGKIITKDHPEYLRMPRRRWDTHKALNRLIQGSAADQMKAAMLALWKEKKVPLVTVHDEIGLSVVNKEEAEHWGKVMCDCVTLLVPNRVDVEVGKSWGDSMRG